jgi:hypothetical protein
MISPALSLFAAADALYVGIVQPLAIFLALFFGTGAAGSPEQGEGAIPNFLDIPVAVLEFYLDGR